MADTDRAHEVVALTVKPARHQSRHIGQNAFCRALPRSASSKHTAIAVDGCVTGCLARPRVRPVPARHFWQFRRVHGNGEAVTRNVDWRQVGARRSICNVREREWESIPYDLAVDRISRRRWISSHRYRPSRNATEIDGSLVVSFAHRRPAGRSGGERVGVPGTVERPTPDRRAVIEKMPPGACCMTVRRPPHACRLNFSARSVAFRM